MNDFSSEWTEYQLVSAGRGLAIPGADEQPPAGFIPRPVLHESPRASAQNLNSLTVPIGPRTLSAASDRSGSYSNSALPSPSFPNPPRTSSPFKPRAKQALAAALSVGSRNGSQTDIVPRESSLPHDAWVNGQPIEVYLYKEASECPICFLYYPPHLNRTRCCDQPICSECFVQIKRPDPHFPEHHGEPNGGSSEDAPSSEQLISEPATCPYCQQAEFGVTYEPPPFRRGLTYSSHSSFAAMSTAMSSQSSLNSANLSPPSPLSGARRRTQSLSATAPNVITTDRIRPDWATKLAALRAHQARRAAAATALHAAAYLLENPNQSRSFAFARPRGFSRRSTTASATGGSSLVVETNSPAADSEAAAEPSSAGPEPGPRSSSGRGLLANMGRRSRMEELEDMMFAEAVRLSLAAEEERKHKAEKEARKEAKKKEKEERKAFKQQQKGSDVYGSGNTSASGSTLSLGIGRRRGNSGASNLRVEAALHSAAGAASTSTEDAAASSAGTNSVDKGKAVDRGLAESASVDSTPGSGSSTSPLPIPMSGPPRGPSHLRQMSNASSMSSSLADTPSGSFAGASHLDAANPRSSGLSLGNRGEDADRDPGSAGMDPMFNFRSLAAMVGVHIEGEHAGLAKEDAPASKDGSPASGDDLDDYTQPGSVEDVEQSVATLLPQASTLSTPEVMVTPETPAGLSLDEGKSKQLGHEAVVARLSEAT